MLLLTASITILYFFPLFRMPSLDSMVSLLKIQLLNTRGKCLILLFNTLGSRQLLTEQECRIFGLLNLEQLQLSVVIKD